MDAQLIKDFLKLVLVMEVLVMLYLGVIHLIRYYYHKHFNPGVYLFALIATFFLCLVVVLVDKYVIP